jgi:uncharacterized protein (DUF2164 family)
MRKESPINLSKERKAAMIAEIKHYFAKERNEELGDPAAERVLDFIAEKLAPEFYNQGVDYCVPVHERGHGGYAGGKDGVKKKRLFAGKFRGYSCRSS